MKQEEKLSQHEWNFFLRGAAGMDIQRPPKPNVDFINLQAWNAAVDIDENLPDFKGITNDILKTPVWVKIGELEVWLVCSLIHSLYYSL